MKNLGILLSGRGSNFEAIANNVTAGKIPNARIAVVISNKPDAGGIEVARRLGIATLVIPSKAKQREEHDREIVDALISTKSIWSAWLDTCDCCHRGSCSNFLAAF